MKILKQLLLITFISIVSFSCSNDDDDDNGTTTVNQANLEGIWKFTTSTTNGETDTDLWICDLEDTIEFMESEFINKYYSDPSGDNGPNCELAGTFNSTYTISGNTITIEGFSQEVLTLNSTTLVIEDIDEGDVYTETYTKQ